MARYRHPKHGYHVASYGEDLAALKAAGWVLDEPTPVGAPDPTHEPAPAPVAATPPTIRRGPGRPRKGD